MMTLLIFLLVAWLVLTVLGVLIEGLFWLAVIGVVLFLGTAGYAAIKRRASRQVT
jgi:LPXTG-motif cell wall-anchored protein